MQNHRRSRSGRAALWALTFAAAVAASAVILVVRWSLELPPPTAPVEVEVPRSILAP